MKHYIHYTIFMTRSNVNFVSAIFFPTLNMRNANFYRVNIMAYTATIFDKVH